MTPGTKLATTLCVDVGSTFTKGLLVDDATGAILGRASHRTTIESDVMDGLEAVRAELGAVGTELGAVAVGRTLVCSSAGGGLRLAVVGYERQVTAEAGHRVGLSAGARVCHVAAGPLTGADVAALRASRPDIILLVGGTDGGNAEVLRHNAARLAAARVKAPVVVAGNAAVADEVVATLRATNRTVRAVANVLPRIGVVNPEPAREAIRATFLEHVIGGKRLSRGRGFAELVRAATPDAVLSGVEVLAGAVAGDVMVIDIGGATTDVYSVITPQGEDATLAKEVVAPLWHMRTVEADLGMRWNAEGIVSAADAERLTLAPATRAYAAAVAADVGALPVTSDEWAAEAELARSAAVIAARRHGRPASPGGSPRPLLDVVLLVGSGGVLRHAPEDVAAGVLTAVTSDVGGGWKVPANPRTEVDAAYVLFAVGLLAREDPAVANRLVQTWL